VHEQVPRHVAEQAGRVVADADGGPAVRKLVADDREDHQKIHE
jgi:hypothetical protein